MAGRYLTQMLQILQLAVLAVGTESLTDWERDNFGVRTEHHKDDLINKVNLDENAPKIVKTHKWKTSAVSASVSQPLKKRLLPPCTSSSPSSAFVFTMESRGLRLVETKWEPTAWS